MYIWLPQRMTSVTNWGRGNPNYPGRTVDNGLQLPR